jgi:hypothetical protein
MAKLYPPIIEGTIPAFYGDSITIPYSMNRTVNRSEFEGFSLKIKTVQNNLHLTTLTSYSYNNSTVTFYLSVEDRNKLNVAQFYKVQLAYIEKDTKMIGHYSSVGVVKYTEKPEISIEGMEAGAYNRHQYIYTGVYSQKDKDYTEKVSTYRFKVYDLDNNILADTGDLIHDTSKDNNDTPYESYDNFEFTKELVSGETCKIQYEITTVNGLHIKTPKYKFVQGAMVKPALDAILTTEVDNENAYVKLGMFGVSNSGDYYYHKDSTELIVTGNFIVSRQRVNEPGN